jgi:hypothetical protein
MWPQSNEQIRQGKFEIKSGKALLRKLISLLRGGIIPLMVFNSFRILI